MRDDRKVKRFHVESMKMHDLQAMIQEGWIICAEQIHTLMRWWCVKGFAYEMKTFDTVSVDRWEMEFLLYQINEGVITKAWQIHAFVWNVGDEEAAIRATWVDMPLKRAKARPPMIVLHDESFQQVFDG